MSLFIYLFIYTFIIIIFVFFIFIFLGGRGAIGIILPSLLQHKQHMHVVAKGLKQMKGAMYTAGRVHLLYRRN